MIWRMVKALIAGIMLVMGLMMVLFVISAGQTIDWCIENKVEIPWQASAILVAAVIWSVIVISVPQEWYDDLKKALTNLTKE